MKTGPPCPQCGTVEPLPIVYGFPTERAWQEVEQQQIALGGCCIDEHSPAWKCRSCGHRYESLPGTEVAP